MHFVNIFWNQAKVFNILLILRCSNYIQVTQSDESGTDDSIADPDFDIGSEAGTSSDSENSGSGVVTEAEDGVDVDCVSLDQPAISPGAKKRRRSAADKKIANITKYQLMSPCKCRKNCVEKIEQDRRRNIHSQFWSLDYNSRRSYIYNHIRVQQKSRSRPRSGDCVRNFSRFYTLPDASGQNVFVCKSFFLKTLGYSSDKVITSTLLATPSGALTPPADKRGKHAPANKKTDDTRKLITDHIQSHNPSISHYRREHAPNRLYLPGDLTITGMHKDFQEKHPDVSVCYETYRKVLDEMNISFAKLGEEECELCMIYNKHEHDSQDSESCTKCRDWLEHNERARLARTCYITDKDAPSDKNWARLSTDMQKILMLPAMPGVKTAVFTRRLVAFHQTFAPLGKRTKSTPAVGVIWNEAIAGRNADDVASAFAKCFDSDSCRDAKYFVIWCDNCTGQNKNWTLYTALCFTVNKPGGPEQITLKYLERGHTFMSADSFHACVEKSMKQKGSVYDFADFSDIIRKNGLVLEMSPTDFTNWPNGSSSAKFTNKPVLRDVCEVEVSCFITMFMQVNCI